MDITGKTALVTGANRGLGRQLAAQLRDRGARVGQAGRTASGGSMESTHTAESSPSRVSARALPWLSRRTGFWAIAFSFLAVAAFSTAPSSLYGLYEQQEHLSSLTITIIYAVYALGIVVSLLLAGHVSDWYGRRAVLLPALAVAVVAAVIFLTWRSLAGIIVARVLTGLALGAAVATATAFVTDLDAGPDGAATRRAGIVATIANIGGLALGPLIAGLLARYAGHGLTLPFIVFLALLLAAVGLVIVAPEGHAAIHPRPKYRPQRLKAPANGHSQFLAATTGVCTAFAVGGLFAGLAGTFLAGPLHQPSPALTGLTIFLTFGAGVLVQTTTTSWPARRLLAAGIVPMIVGLCLLVVSAWTSPPSLALFLSRRNRRRHRYWRDHPRQPDRGDLHRQPGRSGRRPGDVLHRRLRRRVVARRRGRDHTAAPQSSTDAADLRRSRRPRDPGRRPHPYPAAESSSASRGRAGPASRHNGNDARRHGACQVHGRAVHGSWHVDIDTDELQGNPLP